MMVLLEDTLHLLENAPVSGRDTDQKIRHLLRAEYLRKLGQYRRADQALTQKYGLPFTAFIQKQTLEKEGYRWEVETDAMDWETAISGIQTIQRKLSELSGE